MAHTHAKLIIIGSGPAGYTAAIYAARAMLEPVLISGFQPGGQLMITTDVENYPGFADVIQGPWLMEQMRLQAEHVGTQMISDHIVKVDLKQRPFRLEGDSGDDLYLRRARHRDRRPGQVARPALRRRSSRASASRPAPPATASSIRGKEVVVVGGGNTAVEEALYLANLASKVTVVHRRDSLPRRAHPAGPPVQASQDRGGLELGRRGDLRQREPRSPSPMCG